MVNEWTVVSVIVVLIGLFFTVGRPVINLNSAITTLTVKIEHMQSDEADESRRNTESHAKMCEHLETHDNTLVEHDKRITKIEYETHGK